MKLTQCLLGPITNILFIVLSIDLVSAEILASSPRDDYHEDLFLKPLADGKLFAQFRFETFYRKDIKSLRWENKFEIFPLSIADLVASTDLNKLHFSLTKGNWNYKDWGYSTRPSPPGAEIRVQFSRHNENPSRHWKRLVTLLSGKFCASLTSADQKNLVSSKLAYGPLSTLLNTTEHYLYSNLPSETLCTENLTPWKKLLPCYSSSGLASLLNAVNLLKSSYSSLAADVEPLPCYVEGQRVEKCDRVQLTQTISVVFNPLHLFEGKQTWSLAKIFGSSIQKRCPVATHSRVHVDITTLDDNGKLYPTNYTEKKMLVKSGGKVIHKRNYATFDVNAALSNSTQFNLGIKQTQLFKRPPYSARVLTPVHLTTHVAGVGASDGTIVATVFNNLDKPTRVTYMHVVPHFLPVYLHTLTIKTKSGQELKPDRLNFVLSENTKPTLIEFSIVIQPFTTVYISYDFERAFLRWSDYQPDANKGVLLGAASISIPSHPVLQHIILPVNSVGLGVDILDEDSLDEGDIIRVYAKPLIVILPTPDFSMPYNVICLVSSVLAAAFGPLYNMTTIKRTVIKVNKKEKSEDSKEEQQESKKDQ